jgi:hypothetical protein
VPGSSAYAGYGPGQVLAWPYYGGLGGAGKGANGKGASAWTDSQVMTCDAVPPGEVAVRRDEPVRATEVAIPIGAVAGVQDGVRLRITRQEVHDLPAVAVDHQAGRPVGSAA